MLGGIGWVRWIIVERIRTRGPQWYASAMRTNTRILAAAITTSFAFAASTTIAVAGDPPSTVYAPKVVRVFLLAGQSNMEGHGVVDLDDERDYNGGRGNLVEFLASDDGAPWRTLRTDAGAWTERDDVFVSYLTERGEL